MFSWQTLGPILPTEHRLNATAYLSIVADHIIPLWLQCTIFWWLLPAGYCIMSQSSNHLRLVSWTWQWVHLLKCPPQSPDLNPIEHLWDVVEREIHIMDVQPTLSNLQLLRDAIMSIWTKISEECFQHLVESMPRRIKAVLKEKGGPTRY